MYYFIKYGYNGDMFTGFQHKNGDNSVEDTIIKVLEKYGINKNIESAARTDRYVSALGNVFLVETDMDIIKILKILNSHIKYMFFRSYALLENYYNPRHNSSKKYSYILHHSDKTEKIIYILKKFEGKHDFINFCRADGRNTIRTIDKIDYINHGKMDIINFYGRSFIWHQLRSIIAFAIMGNIDDDPFMLDQKFTYLADPQPLILMDIKYNDTNFSNFDFMNSKKYFKNIENSIAFENTFYELLHNTGVMDLM